MTPIEKKDLVAELSGVLATVIDRKLDPFVKRIEKLERVDTQHAAGIRDARVEVTRSHAEIEKSTTETLLAAARHTTGAIEALTGEVQDVKKRLEDNLQPRALVELPDGKGGKSIRPASLVAAESSVRTENAQKGMVTTVLNAALETTTAKDNAAAAKRRATITMIAIIVQGVLFGAWNAYQAIAHVAQ